MLSLSDLSSHQAAFLQLAGLHEHLESTGITWFDLDISSVEQVDPSMLAALAAVLAREKGLFDVNIRATTEATLTFSQAEFPAQVSVEGHRPESVVGDRLVSSHNTGELPEHEVPYTPSPNGRRRGSQVTVMKYKRLGIADSALFQEYVEKHFAGEFIPKMSPALTREFRRSICEVFQNAVDHSETRLGIFASGHYSPERQILELSIADRGMGIMENIRRRGGIVRRPDWAIEWAVEGTHTTRTPREGRPGGLGLKLIRSFVKLNEGRLQIVSDRGYWCLEGGGKPFTRVLPSPFPGTVVSIEINTADTHSYRLREEVDPKKIF